MGRNGAGKTTLVNALLANSPTTPEAELRKTSGYDGPFVDSGKVIWGHEASIGYFAQDHRSLIEGGMTVLEWLHQWDPAAVSEEIRGLLGKMLFAREEATKSTNVLSGGEAARLLFCKLMLQKPNVLVLDEPTNHLDLESINALNIALQRYQGTVLLVTHDHDLIDEVATRIWHFESDHKITDFKGAYEEYQAALAWLYRRNREFRSEKDDCTIFVACKSSRFSTDFHKRLLLRLEPLVADNGGDTFLRRQC